MKCQCYSYRLCAVCSQMDVISLFPMEIFYYFTGVNSLLRFPRLLKVRMCFIFMHMFVLLNWMHHWLLSFPLSTWLSLSSTTEWKLWWRKRTSTGEESFILITHQPHHGDTSFTYTATTAGQKSNPLPRGGAVSLMSVRAGLSEDIRKVLCGQKGNTFLAREER